MKKYLNYKLPVFGLMIMLLASCYSGQDVAPIDSPDDNSLVTITPDGDYSSIKEGDILTYTISVDKMVTNDVTFGVTFGDNSVAGAGDISVVGGVLSAFSTSTTISVEILADDFPELGELADMEISAAGDLAWNWQLNPAYTPAKIATDLANVNDPTLLTIAFGWDDPEHITDFDMLVESMSSGSWGSAATADNPEITTAIWNEDPDDTFYVGVDPYDVPDGDIPFTATVGYPDGTVEFFTSTFNKANLGDYTVDTYTAWGAPMYRVLTVVKTGSSYSISFAF